MTSFLYCIIMLCFSIISRWWRMFFANAIDMPDDANSCDADAFGRKLMREYDASLITWPVKLSDKQNDLANWFSHRPKDSFNKKSKLIAWIDKKRKTLKSVGKKCQSTHPPCTLPLPLVSIIWEFRVLLWVMGREEEGDLTVVHQSLLLAIPSQT